jgi:type III pantothenate kinase
LCTRIIAAMLIALDVGNTNVTFGIVVGRDVTFVDRAATPSADHSYQLEVIVDEALGHAPIGTVGRHGLVVASVVPAVSHALRELAERRDIALLVADETTIPLPIRVDDPAGVGDDRLVNAFAATRLYGAPAIVVDLGTATTFDVVDADGAFVGGAIAPGVGLGLEALASRTAQLPRVPVALPPRAIGTDTVAALQSGSVLGYIGLVTHLLRAISDELDSDGGTPPRVILTGGLAAHQWATAIPGVHAIDPLLTLRGLAILHAELARTGSAAPA